MMVPIMDIETLRRQNPWWDLPDWVEEDESLIALRETPVPWTPGLLDPFPLGEGRVYTLRGPRQVGKTTLVKVIVRRLIESGGKDAKDVLYFSCETLRHARDLADVVESYLDWREHGRTGRLYLFLDEVSSLEEWSRGIFGLANRGRLRRCTLLLTGSHALDVRRQSERLPGRRGEGKSSGPEDVLDRVLLPMSFGEFALTVDRELGSRLASVGLSSAEARRETIRRILSSGSSVSWSDLLLLQTRLDRLMDQYLLTGGFPRPVNEFSRSGTVSLETYEAYVRVISGDLVRWDYDERTARELLSGIAEKMGSPLSWRTLAADTDLGSHHTAARYVDALERSFVVQSLYQYDLRRRRRSPRKDRKLYIRDPFMFHTLRAWAAGHPVPFEFGREYLADPARRGALLEAVVADHLSRLAYSARPAALFDSYDRVLFWRSKKGWEVDFVLGETAKPIAIQLTLTRARTKPRRALRAFGGGVVLTETGDADSIPLSPFLCLV
jgi:hypothetical protein